MALERRGLCGNLGGSGAVSAGAKAGEVVSKRACKGRIG